MTEDEKKKLIEKAELEEKYAEVVLRIQPLIHDALKRAKEAIAEATQLADEHRIPFRSSVSEIAQNYTPTDLPLDRTTVEKITGVWAEYDGDGWEHSAFC